MGGIALNLRQQQKNIYSIMKFIPNEDIIRKRAYEVYQETGCNDALLNWKLAEMDIVRQEYYRQEGGCWHCGRRFEE